MGFGGKDIVTGYRYYGSYAQVVCIGQIDELQGIYNGDTQVWPVDTQGALAIGSGAPVTLVTSIGNIEFFWGTPTQALSDDLSGLVIDTGAGAVLAQFPGLKNVCYCVCKGVCFGNQVTPPVLKFKVKRIIEPLPYLPTHELNGDMLIPEIIVDMLFNTLYGAGVSSDKINIASFVDAAAATYTEGMSASLMIDQTTTMREMVGRLAQYIDAIVYRDVNTVTIALNRYVADTSVVPTINEAKLLDEPQQTNNGFADTWNYTRVNFTDMENGGEEAVEVYDDPANASALGQRVEKSVSLPYITRRAVAKIAAKMIGLRGGQPVNTYSLRLTPDMATLRPGDLVKFTYAKMGIIDPELLRVTKVDFGTATDLAVEIEATTDTCRDTANDYTPPADVWNVEPTQGDGGSDPFVIEPTTLRIAALPLALVGSNEYGTADGILGACNRPTLGTTRSALYFNYSTAREYMAVTSSSSFPVKATILWWVQNNDQTATVRVRIPNDYDRDAFDFMLRNSIDLCLVTGQRSHYDLSQSNRESIHKTTSQWAKLTGEVYPVTTEIYDIIVMSGSYTGNSPIYWSLDTPLAVGNFPTVEAYIGSPDNFLIWKTSTYNVANTGSNQQSANSPFNDPQQIRYFKATVGGATASQSVTEVDAVIWHRDDPTMCAEGTFSLDWGLHAPHVTEAVDVALGDQDGETDDPTVTDLNEWLLRRYWDESDTGENSELHSDVDVILGRRFIDIEQVYNPATL